MQPFNTMSLRTWFPTQVITGIKCCSPPSPHLWPPASLRGFTHTTGKSYLNQSTLILPVERPCTLSTSLHTVVHVSRTERTIYSRFWWSMKWIKDRKHFVVLALTRNLTWVSCIPYASSSPPSSFRHSWTGLKSRNWREIWIINAATPSSFT